MVHHMAHPATQLLTASDVARQWGVSVRTVHRMVHRKQLNPVMRGPGGHHGTMFFAPEDVEAIPMVTVTKPAPSAA